MQEMKCLMFMVTATTAICAWAGEVNVNATNRFEISGMHCDGCARGLTAEFKATPGVASATVTFTNQLAVVRFDTNRVTTAGLLKVVKEAGYQAKLQP